MVANNQLFLTDVPALEAELELQTCPASFWLNKLLWLMESPSWESLGEYVQTEQTALCTTYTLTTRTSDWT